jgi:iron complex transport system substrate-binding protein
LFFAEGRSPMVRYMRYALLALSCAVLFAGSSCAQPKPDETAVPTSVTDQLGRTVKLQGLPHRIISIAPSNTEILYALGLQDRIVAVTSYDNYPPEVKDKPNVGGFSTPNLEQIVSFSPDLVVAAPIHDKQIIPQLEAKGIPVIALAPKTLDDVMQAITLMGKVTGTADNAREVVAGMDKRIKAITDKTDKLAPDKKPKAVYIVWDNPLMASGTGTFHDELIRKAGGLNVMADATGYPTISLETLVKDNPDVIFAGVGMGEGQDAPLKFAQNEPRLRDVLARANNRVYGIDSDVSGRAGPRIVDVLEQFAKLMHPELFK